MWKFCWKFQFAEFCVGSQTENEAEYCRNSKSRRIRDASRRIRNLQNLASIQPRTSRLMLRGIRCLLVCNRDYVRYPIYAAFEHNLAGRTTAPGRSQRRRAPRSRPRSRASAARGRGAPRAWHRTELFERQRRETKNPIA